jgi:hypothetical protein
MPKIIDGIKLNDDEHTQWKKIYTDTNNAAIATSAVQKARKNNLKDLEDKKPFNVGNRIKQLKNIQGRNKKIMDELFND